MNYIKKDVTAQSHERDLYCLQSTSKSSNIQGPRDARCTWRRSPERTVKSELTQHHRKPKASYKVIAQGKGFRVGDLVSRPRRVWGFGFRACTVLAAGFLGFRVHGV